MEYRALKSVATSGPNGRLYEEGDVENFNSDPGKHWEPVSEVIAALAPKTKPAPKTKDGNKGD